MTLREAATWMAVAATGFPTAAMADSLVEAVPTGWRVQDYLDGGVSVFHTSSTCDQGSLVMPSSAPADSKNRLWALLVSAKMASKPVGIYYQVSGGACIITSFYLKEQ